MAVKRELKSKLPQVEKPAVDEERRPASRRAAAEKAQPEVVENEKGELVIRQPKKRGCSFCESKTSPGYWDGSNLRRFLNDRGRIYPRTRSGNCAKHQRQVTRHIKYARFLAIFPFKVQI